MPQRLILDPAAADASGLVAIGGDLRPATLLRAYRRGIFPWYDKSTPICWWSPDPRAVLPLDGLHVSRRLARTLRSGRFHVTRNRGFSSVIRGCAENREDGTWLVADMIDAYERLHELGHAHSVEVWRDGDLVGGIYGVAIGGFFSAESMFHRTADSSKIALVELVDCLKTNRFALLDIQFVTPHTVRMGGIEIPRAAYLEHLAAALTVRTKFPASAEL